MVGLLLRPQLVDQFGTSLENRLVSLANPIVQVRLLAEHLGVLAALIHDFLEFDADFVLKLGLGVVAQAVVTVDVGDALDFAVAVENGFREQNLATFDHPLVWVRDQGLDEGGHSEDTARGLRKK